MTRKFYDSVDATDLPLTGEGYFAYGNGLYRNIATVHDRFPTKPLVGITVNITTVIQEMLDVENGDATPTQAPAWCTAKRLRNQTPYVYCSFDNFSAVSNAFARLRVSLPLVVIAKYDGIGVIPMTIPNCIGKQYQSTTNANFDTSVMADYLPTVDPKPEPQPKEIQDMTWIATVTGTNYLIPTTRQRKIGITSAENVQAILKDKSVVNIGKISKSFAAKFTG